MEKLIAIRQLPVLEERFKELSAEIDRQAEEALSLAVTADTLAQVKRVRAALSKQHAELEYQRKAVKNAIMEPYDKLNEAYRKYIGDKFDDVDEKLKARINDVENAVKSEKFNRAVEYYNELAAAEGIDWLPIGALGLKVTMTKTDKALRGEIDAFVERVVDAIKTIDALPNSAEVAAEYKRTLDLSGSIAAVEARHKAVEQEEAARTLRDAAQREEAERVAQVEAAAKEAAQITVAAPTAMPEPVPAPAQQEKLLTVQFTVTATVEKLRELKQFLRDGGYQYA